MPYKESEATCDWCNGVSLGEKDSLACQGCMEKLEEENAELTKRVEELEAELKEKGDE